MNKQMTAGDLGIVFAGVIVAIIALFAVQRLNTPNFPAIQSSSPVIKESSAELAANSTRSEGQGQYSAIIHNPTTGAELIAWNAPKASSLETAAAPEVAIAAEGQNHFRTIVVHSQTGAQLFEWQAPKVR